MLASVIPWFYQNAIEPAYGDSVAFEWRRSYNEFHATTIVLLQEDPLGYVVDPVTLETFKVIPHSESFIEDCAEVEHYPTESSDWYRTGSISWPGPDKNGNPISYYSEFPSGRHRIGIVYDDDYDDDYSDDDIQLMDYYIDVGLSVYDVWTYNSAPFYPCQNQQNTTLFHYHLSSEVQSCTIKVGRPGEEAEIEGTATLGENTPPEAWDGANKDGDYYHNGQFPISFDITTKDGPVGEPLSILFPDLSETVSFKPADGELLNVDYRLQEPVRRLQATSATIQATVYDGMDGHIIRLLDDQDRDIDNDPNDSQTVGGNTLTWDGCDEGGQVVTPGEYTIAITAKDNAGVGCESKLHTVAVSVLAGDPGCVLTELSNLSTESLDTIIGYTNSESTVAWTDSIGGSGTATPDTDGQFSFTISSTPGLHTLTVTTTRAGYPEKQVTSQVFINGLTLSSPQPDSQNSFNPDQEQALELHYTSQASDSFDLVATDLFDSVPCIDQCNPVPAFELLNGFVTPKIIRRSTYSATSGSNTISWDGRDDNGQLVPAGVYQVEVIRSNLDDLLVLHSGVEAIVNRSASAPTISNVHADVHGNTIKVSWTTSPSTTGAVLYMQDGVPAGRVPSKSLSSSHTVYLPVVESERTYDYWVVADADGHTSISTKLSFTAGKCESIGELAAIPIDETGTSVIVGWTTDIPIPDRKWFVQYAEVGPSISPLQWLTVQDRTSGPNHVVKVNCLTANSEYVFRVVAADDDTLTNATRSQFSGFMTKYTNPFVAVTSPAEEYACVSGTTSVIVNASDAVKRFRPNDPTYNGMTKVVLEVDGEPAGEPSRVSGASDEYCVQIDTTQLGDGFHRLQAFATDDFGNESDYLLNVCVRNGRGAQSSSPYPSGCPQWRCSYTACKLACPKRRDRVKDAVIIKGPPDSHFKLGEFRSYPIDNMYIDKIAGAEWRNVMKNRPTWQADVKKLYLLCEDCVHLDAVVLRYMIDAKYAGFTFVGHGVLSPPAMLFVGEARDHKDGTADPIGLSASQARTYIDQLHQTDPAVLAELRAASNFRYLHLYTCGSDIDGSFKRELGGITWDQRFWGYTGAMVCSVALHDALCQAGW